MFGALSFFAACQARAITFLPTWYKYLDSVTDSSGRCVPQINAWSDFAKILLALVDMLLWLGGVVAVAYVIYGGINYIMSRGEPDKVKNAQEMIQNALIGLVVAMLATGIVTFIGNQVTR